MKSDAFAFVTRGKLQHQDTDELSAAHLCNLEPAPDKAPKSRSISIRSPCIRFPVRTDMRSVAGYIKPLVPTGILNRGLVRRTRISGWNPRTCLPATPERLCVQGVCRRIDQAL